jgi:hypothetical protein
MAFCGIYQYPCQLIGKIRRKLQKERKKIEIE